MRERGVMVAPSLEPPGVRPGHGSGAAAAWSMTRKHLANPGAGSELARVDRARPPVCTRLMPHTPGGLAAFNACDREDAEKELLSCCASRAFAGAVAAGRPYPDLDRLADAAGRAVQELSWAEVLEALGAHPRIGERPDGASREAAWSRREQAGVE